MDTVRLIVLVIHLLGWAALFGGLLVQASSEAKAVNGPMRDGVGTAFLTGLILVGLLEAGDSDVNHAKIGVKLLIGLVLLVLVLVNMRKDRIPQGLWAGLILLTITNVSVAVLWSSAHV